MNRGDLRSNQEKRSYWAHQNELRHLDSILEGQRIQFGTTPEQKENKRKVDTYISECLKRGDTLERAERTSQATKDSDVRNGSAGSICDNKLLIAGAAIVAVAVVGVGVTLTTNDKFRKRVSGAIKNFAADFFGNYE